MADNFGLKIGIDGEKEFKNALREINSTFKVLGSEMNLVTSQFDKNDKSIEAKTAKSKVLNKSIEEQKNKIEVLTKALKNSEDSFGENDKRAKKWATELNNAKADLNKMESELKETTSATNKFGEELKETGNDAEKAGDKFSKVGGVMKGIGTAVAGALVAAGAAALKLGKEVVSTYADFEQLVGGVDTLFKSNSSTIQNYANNAYKTAGLSANEYMETVTSFSASLIQSLGGDTEKAAKYADMAITDMADNSNKMGTSMESVQNAYQGFAKQNYTMLDNLKLGYGGTKSEMERLLKDAGAISGIKYDVSSYSDVVSAIHVIQDNMGIAGTTAKEAEGTITGSLDSMKSAFKNLVAGLGNPDADIKGLAQNVADSFKTVLDNIVPIIENLVSALPTVFSALIGALQTLLPTIIPMLFDLFKQVLTALIEMLPTIIPMVVEMLFFLVDAIIENLPILMDAALQLILALAMGLVDALPELIPAIIDMVFAIQDTLIENLPLLIEVAIQLVIALAMGMVEAIPKLVLRIPEIIAAVVKTFAEYDWASMGRNIMEGLRNGITGMVEKIKETVRNVGRKIMDAFKSILGINSPSTVFAGYGKNLIQGLWNGINSMSEWIWSKIGSFVNGITDVVKKFFGIKSPSKVFENEIGKNLGLGVGIGFEKSMDQVSKDMKNAIPTNFDLDANLQGTVSSTTKSNSGGLFLTLSIDKFYNNGQQDINQLADEVSIAIASKMRRRQEAF